ncbi:hypothetical protein GQ44DRAFT_711293 [Phaeosphaeriaceae sp. PMI808]|nr:hypothetical protein GQ44DRAFT_711293 [Phaeosphaeriaceae sp. PMI808]
MTFNGGQFKFFLVTIEAAGIVISTTLRIGIHCGIESTDESLAGSAFAPKVKAGTEAAIVTHVTKFFTNVTHIANDKKYKLKIAQKYNMALDSATGASI